MLFVQFVIFVHNDVYAMVKGLCVQRNVYQIVAMYVDQYQY